MRIATIGPGGMGGGIGRLLASAGPRGGSLGVGSERVRPASGVHPRRA